MRVLYLACVLFYGKAFAAPVQSHQSGGAEHIVIIDRDHPTPPHVAEVLDRLTLHEGHPDVRLIYNNSAFRGFAASMKSRCLDLLANMSDISVVEEATSVGRATLSKRQSSLGYDTRLNAPWGLQRISTAVTVSGSAKAMDYTYSYANSDLGQGADIYVVDTGIYTEHNAFGGRAKMAWSYNNDMTDNDGHGTHVSGTAAGDVLGVASNANLFGVKALDSNGGGWSSNVIAGIDYIIQTHDARKSNSSSTPPFLGSVISMSLASSSPVQAINAAIAAAISAGIHTVVAAGNDGQDACRSSPASSGGLRGPAITVGSVGMDAAHRSSFSNYGDCVDVYAPGEDVISAWIGGRDMVNSLSGTSMATPHVTGIVAYAMGNRTLAGNPGLMKEWVRMMAVSVGVGGGGGVVVANNGVRGGEGVAEGMLGFEKTGVGAGFRMVGGGAAGRLRRAVEEGMWRLRAFGAVKSA
ncbi:hypothetical protein B0A55_00483 [Friedmanniomyces simplex]|uniref:Peptidase S8/S53 domain-containing protein n=1 Tax=Friedmanniomyces simplex TaxID=329884 RepID=A0A4U0XZS9_9PEZI|nr:hypothetical protein B0A55_00483 [Friedmanniomyces simplex]